MKNPIKAAKKVARLWVFAAGRSPNDRLSKMECDQMVDEIISEFLEVTLANVTGKEVDVYSPYRP